MDAFESCKYVLFQIKSQKWVREQNQLISVGFLSILFKWKQEGYLCEQIQFLVSQVEKGKWGWIKATQEVCKRQAWVGHMQNLLLHPANIFLSMSCVLE